MYQRDMCNVLLDFPVTCWGFVLLLFILLKYGWLFCHLRAILLTHCNARQLFGVSKGQDIKITGES